MMTHPGKRKKSCNQDYNYNDAGLQDMFDDILPPGADIILDVESVASDRNGFFM